MLKATKSVNRCQAKKCGNQLEHSEKNISSITDEIVKATNDYVAERITAEQLKKKTSALKKRSVNAKATEDLSRCTFEKCNRDALKMVKDVNKVLQSGCNKGNKGACALNKKSAHVKTVSDYIAFVKRLAA